MCQREGFTPRIRIGVTALPGVAQQAHHASEITGHQRRIYAVTYGEPPDPPAVAAVLDALTSSH